MKKSFLNFAILFASTTICFTACKKKSSDPEPEPDPVSTTTGGSTTTSGFTWTQSGGATNTADSAYYVEGGWGSGIRAYKGGSIKFEINFTPTTLTAATYTLSAGHGLTYVSGGLYYDDQSSVFNVTTVANNKASGNYSGTATYNSGGASSSLPLTVQFVDIPKK